MKSKNNKERLNWRFTLNEILKGIKIKIKKSIRFELMIVIGICFLISISFYNFTNTLLKRQYTEPQIIYDYDAIERNAAKLIRSIETEENLNLNDKRRMDEIFSNLSNSERAYITDLEGNILYRTENVEEESVDIYSVLKSAMTNVNIYEYDQKANIKEKKYVMPLKINEDRVYLIYSKVPEARIKYNTISVSNSSLALFLTFIVFIVTFVSITNKKMKYLDDIASGLKIIASGNLNYRIDEKGNDEIRNIANNINYMAKEIGEKIYLERVAEKAKADLITNVSHDLRTPLTSIMGYIGLVIQNRYKNEEEMKEYLNIAFSKSERLKLLIDDLFQYTKLNNNGIKLEKATINMVEFLEQFVEEMMPIVEEEGLEIVKKFECKKLYISIDATKMIRVFENLLTNAIKYSYKPGQIVLGIYEKNNRAVIFFRNKGDHITKEKADKLFDRFYRVDESRNTNTGGSGLGLAISKNIVELHGGKIWGESIGNNITFYMELPS